MSLRWLPRSILAFASVTAVVLVGGGVLPGATPTLAVPLWDWEQLGSDVNGSSGGGFGASVSLSGDGTIMAVVAPNDNETLIFERVVDNPSGWVQRGVAIAGESVSLSDDGAIAAIDEPDFSDVGVSGRTRVFQWDGSAWRQLGDAINRVLADGSRSTVSISADGTTVAIGTQEYDDATTDVGRTRIFRWDGSAWVQLGAAIIGDTATARSGASISLSDGGSVLVIGEPGDRFNPAPGRVRVVRWNETDGSWDQLGSVFDGAAGHSLGRAVSISGDGTTIALGRRGDDVDQGNANAGAVDVYQWNSSEGSWSQVGDAIFGEDVGDLSGEAVALSDDGTTVAIGATNASGDLGKVRVYRWDPASGTWGKVGTDRIGETEEGNFGYAVALSDNGTVLAIGAPEHEVAGRAVGLARVFLDTTPLPEPPTNVTAVVEGTTATVSWTAPAANGAQITSYVVTASPGGATCTAMAPALTCEIAGLERGVAYSFAVVAANSVGGGVSSAPSSSVTPEAIAPGAPTDVTVVLEGATATVSWTAPAANGSAITSYVVTASPGGATCTAPAPAVTCAITGLERGVAHSFAVVATNSVGGGELSAPSSSVTPEAIAPGAPTDVVAVVEGTTASVSWTAPDANGSEITSYVVMASPGGATCTAVPPAVTCEITGLEPGVSYAFTVVAANAVGDGVASSQSAAVSPPVATTDVPATTDPAVVAELPATGRFDGGTGVTIVVIALGVLAVMLGRRTVTR